MTLPLLDSDKMESGRDCLPHLGYFRPPMASEGRGTWIIRKIVQGLGAHLAGYEEDVGSDSSGYG
jgi:hypothetical protein